MEGKTMPDYKVERWKEISRPTPAVLVYILGGEGYYVGQWHDPPGKFYPLHKHPEEQSHWVIYGQLEIQVNGIYTYLLGPGDRDFIPAETWHTARVIGDEPVLFLTGVKKPPPPSSKRPKRKPTTKRKPAVKKAKPAEAAKKSATKKPQQKPTTKPKPAARKAKPAKGIQKKSKTKM